MKLSNNKNKILGLFSILSCFAPEKNNDYLTRVVTEGICIAPKGVETIVQKMRENELDAFVAISEFVLKPLNASLKQIVEEDRVGEWWFWYSTGGMKDKTEELLSKMPIYAQLQEDYPFIIFNRFIAFRSDRPKEKLIFKRYWSDPVQEVPNPELKKWSLIESVQTGKSFFYINSNRAKQFDCLTYSYLDDIVNSKKNYVFIDSGIFYDALKKGEKSSENPDLIYLPEDSLGIEGKLSYFRPNSEKALLAKFKDNDGESASCKEQESSAASRLFLDGQELNFELFTLCKLAGC